MSSTFLPEGLCFIERDPRPQALADACEDPTQLIAQLIVESGRAYFTTFYGSEAQATEQIARCLVRANSVFAPANLTLLCTNRAIAGCLVALPGAELEKGQKGDLALVLQTFSAAERAALVKRIHGKNFVSAKAEPEDYYIRTLSVASAFRGQGLGRVLLQQALKRAECAGAKTCKLHVYASNEAAIRLYRASGFSQVAKMQDDVTNDCIYTMARAVGAVG